MKITLLGTGTPTPSLRRMGAGYLVETGGDVILFDLGSGAYHRMLEAGYPPTRISHVFFSHLHYDHCVDYARLLLTRWDQGAGKIPELRVHGPEFMARMTELLFSPDGAFGPDLAARTEHPMSQEIYEARGGVPPRSKPAPEVTELRSGDTVAAGDWKVRAISVPHAQPQLACLAYRLETPAGSFVYSGDTAPNRGLVELAQGCDVLVHMCHYITGTEIGPALSKGTTGHLEAARTAADAGVKTLVLSHITEQMDVPGVPERLIREIGEIFTGHIIWGEDGMQITPGDPLPRKLE